MGRNALLSWNRFFGRCMYCMYFGAHERALPPQTQGFDANYAHYTRARAARKHRLAESRCRDVRPTERVAPTSPPTVTNLPEKRPTSPAGIRVEPWSCTNRSNRNRPCRPAGLGWGPQLPAPRSPKCQGHQTAGTMVMKGKTPRF